MPLAGSVGHVGDGEECDSCGEKKWMLKYDPFHPLIFQSMIIHYGVFQCDLTTFFIKNMVIAYPLVN